MPNPIIAPGVCRFAINGTFAGQDVVNVWDVHIDSEVGSNRDENILAVAAKIVNAWADNILPQVCDDYTFTEVSWVDLDTLGGSTGAVTSGGDEVLPQNGLSAGAPLPSNVAVKIAKVITRTRGERNGRLYLCGVNETVTLAGAPNNVSVAAAGAIDAAFAQFLTDVDEDVVDYESNSVVVHTAAPAAGQPPEFVSFSTINSLRTDLLLSTQRRRLR